MNQPNKEDEYSTEVGEGRTRTEENVAGIPHDPDSEREVSMTQEFCDVRYVVCAAIHPR